MVGNSPGAAPGRGDSTTRTAPRPAFRALLASLMAVALLMSPILVSPALADLMANPGGPYEGFVGENVQFDGTGSANSDGKVAKYQWDFGDGRSGKGATPDHIYRIAGEYAVSLTVTDNDGNTSLPASTIATIVDPTTTTTTIPPGLTTTTSTTPTTTTTTTSSPMTTLEVLGRRIEAATAALHVSATAFTVAPLAWAPGDEITVTLQSDAVVPGYSTVLLLLDGNRLGYPVRVMTGIEATFPGNYRSTWWSARTVSSW